MLFSLIQRPTLHRRMTKCVFDTKCRETKLEPLEAQEAINILTYYLLGDSFYIVDPVSGAQANALIVDEICRIYNYPRYKKEHGIK